MQETAFAFHNLEWPVADSRLAGPVLWLRGWAVAKPGHAFIDLRVRHAGQTHLGVLGLPRTDLAAHFSPDRDWLPAEFIIGVPVRDGPVTITLEVMDEHGAWRALHDFSATIAADGTPPPRVEGRLETAPGGTWTVRDAHHPFHGHLDDPGPASLLQRGRAQVFGWLLDESRPLGQVLATTDTLVFNHLEHSLTDNALATKVSHLPAARHARLRGAVDFPATLTDPACLRVYAVSSEGTAHLCFAQRLAPASTVASPHHSQPQYLPVQVRKPRDLPSGRPRRLLMVLRSLWPNDATLRAKDLACTLAASFRWAIRVVSTEDGPIREDLAQAGIESLIVDPAPFLTARDDFTMNRALDNLRRQIWWTHLDAVAVFDPVCGWAIALARQQGLPVLFDCTVEETMIPDPTATIAVQTLQRCAWNEASAVCFAADTIAKTQASLLAGRAACMIPFWHSPDLSWAARDRPSVAIAPLRVVDWLERHHPDLAARWHFQQGPAGSYDDEKLAVMDDAARPRRLTHAADWKLDQAGLCLGPLFNRGPLRVTIDAAAAGLPLAAPRRSTTEELFRDYRVPLLDEANPLAAAHAFLAFTTAPAIHQREITAAAAGFRARHNPARLIADWEAFLLSIIAS
ncbi:MAG: hypothetical protein RLZZ129_2496 [Verrucomicrobiota bacterium]|jgi:hypothetical protein